MKYFDDMTFSVNTQQAIYNYIVLGYKPGGFLTSLLANDLFAAIQRADAMNTVKFVQICAWVLTNLPEESYGSYEAVTDWCMDKNNRRTDYVKYLDKKEFWKTMGQSYDNP